MPFFLKAEAGSAVSDLLDERLRRLQHQLEESNKSCEGLVTQVEAFNRTAREMCRAAGNAVGALGWAIAVDDARTPEDEDDDHLEEAAAAGGRGSKSNRSRRSGSLGNREPARSELLALQLVESGNEMEEHLRGEVLNPLERVLASRSDIQASVRNRSRASDSLAAAHSEYARAIARYQALSGDVCSGGNGHGHAGGGGRPPPPDVVEAGERVVKASDAFAQAHGTAEEALKGFLEERGRVLRGSMSSFKAAQAGFFVRASRCVSSSVGLEPGDKVNRSPEKIRDVTQRSPAVDAAAEKEEAVEVGVGAGVSLEGEKQKDEDDVGEKVGLVFDGGVRGNGGHDGDGDDRNRDEERGGVERSDSLTRGSRAGSKRRRSSGWFARIVFPSLRDSVSEDEDEDNTGDRDKESGVNGVVASGASAAAMTMYSALASVLPAGEVDENRKGKLEGALKPPAAGTKESVVFPRGQQGRFSLGGGSPRRIGYEESVLRTRRRVSFQRDVIESQDQDEAGAEVATDVEESEDYESESDTTEGFGSDDVGRDWWAEGRGQGSRDRYSVEPSQGGNGNLDFHDSVADATGECLGALTESRVPGWKACTTADDATAAPAMPTVARDDAAFNSVKVAPSDREGEREEGPTEKENESLLLIKNGGGAGAMCEHEHGDSPRNMARASPSPSPLPPPLTTRTPTGASSVLALGVNVEPCYPTEESPPAPTPPPSNTVTPVSPLPTIVATDKSQPHDSQAQPHTPKKRPSKRDESPFASETSNNRESPRAWRLSWWAKASDRHHPPPPAVAFDGYGSVEEESGNSAAEALSLALEAAAAGEVAAAALSAGGAFAPALNTGDAPAVVDSRTKTRTEFSVKAESEVSGERPAAKESNQQGQRRHRQGQNKISYNPSLSVEKLADQHERWLEVAVDFLDVGGLGHVCGVCVAWRDRLGGESGREQWTRCVRLPRGVPEGLRARFYLHVLYDQPAWVSKTFQSTSQIVPGSASPSGSPLPQASSNQYQADSYQACLAQADAEEAEARADAAAEEPLSASHKWLDEIETDVLRTCPPDDASEEFHKSAASVDAATALHAAAALDAVGAFDAHDAKSDGTAESGSSRTLRSAITALFGQTDANGGHNHTAPASGGDVVTPPGTPEAAAAAATAIAVAATAIVEAASSSNSGRNSRVSNSSRMIWRRSSGMMVGGEGGGGRGTRDKLRRVLRALGVYNRRISYCQGMNFVALCLLEASNGDDETAFWILAGMCDRLQLEGLWCQGLERLDLCFFTMDRLLKHHCPSLRQHLADEGVELSMFTSRWFVTLFTSTDVFGRSTSRKIVDMFLVEGWPLLFKLSLGVLLEMRPLLEPTDMEGILKITKFPRAHIFGLRRDGTGRRVAGATFEEAMQGSLCEAIRARQMVEHALLLHISEETLEKHLVAYRLQKLPEPGSD